MIDQTIATKDVYLCDFCAAQLVLAKMILPLSQMVPDINKAKWAHTICEICGSEDNCYLTPKVPISALENDINN